LLKPLLAVLFHLFKHYESLCCSSIENFLVILLFVFLVQYEGTATASSQDSLFIDKLGIVCCGIGSALLVINEFREGSSVVIHIIHYLIRAPTDKIVVASSK
jgi:hypothetical protein